MLKYENEFFFRILIFLIVGIFFATLLSFLFLPNKNDKIIDSCERNGFYFFDHERGITCSPIEKKNNP